MGGFGSGFYARLSGAPKCEHYRCIDLTTLRRRGVLGPGAMGLITFGGADGEKPDRLWVRANADGAGLTFIKRRPDSELGKIFVTFSYTSTAFNGWRLWFCCPGCRRRCRCLYGTNILRCRRCLGLKYASQSERPRWRALRRAEAIRRSLGSTAYGIDPPFPEKPKRMRWRTYEALKRKDEALCSHFLAGAVDLVRALKRRLGRRENG
jgi:hypothetical protein